jgi:hypothetical protein
MLGVKDVGGAWRKLRKEMRGAGRERKMEWSVRACSGAYEVASDAGERARKM